MIVWNMIYVRYYRTKQPCALCTKDIPKYAPSMYNPVGEKNKKFVHLDCWKDLAKSKGIKLEEPPF